MLATTSGPLPTIARHPYSGQRKEEEMGTPTKALAVATTASLTAVIAATVAAGARWWLWAAWAALAAVTIAVVAIERRDR